MIIPDKWQTSEKSIKATRELSKINGQLLNNFLRIDLGKLCTQTTFDGVTGFVEAIGSNIYNYAELLNEDDHMKLFQNAIILLSKDMTETKREGLFYKHIVKNKDRLPESEIEKFLKLPSDRDKVGEGSERRPNIIRKLNSKNLSGVLKAFIALVAWDYAIITKRKKQESINAEKAKAAAEARKSKEEESPKKEEETATTKEEPEPEISCTEMDGCRTERLTFFYSEISRATTASDAQPIPAVESTKKLDTLKQKNDTLKKQWAKIRPFLSPALSSESPWEDPIKEKVYKKDWGGWIDFFPS